MKIEDVKEWLLEAIEIAQEEADMEPSDINHYQTGRLSAFMDVLNYINVITLVEDFHDGKAIDAYIYRGR